MDRSFKTITEGVGHAQSKEVVLSKAGYAISFALVLYIKTYFYVYFLLNNHSERLEKRKKKRKKSFLLSFY